MEKTLDGVEISIEYANDGDARVTEEELRNYLARARENYPHSKLEQLKLEVDGDDVGIHYGFAPQPFERIRRITGYLVGTLDRFNDGKRAEEADRVKHSTAR